VEGKGILGQQIGQLVATSDPFLGWWERGHYLFGAMGTGMTDVPNMYVSWMLQRATAQSSKNLRTVKLGLDRLLR
jgi:hypothetical protein